MGRIFDFIEELKSVVKDGSSEEIYAFMEGHISTFFSTSALYDHYQVIKEVNVDYAQRRLTPKLIKAWLAFLSGDNANAFTIIECVQEKDLRDCYERSLFYSLKALTCFSNEDRLRYAKMSITVLPINDSTFYMANAKLTYGQLLSSMEQYRTAAQMFEESYNLFYAEKIYFAGVVALVNAKLNRFKLGEFSLVIDACNRTLQMSASFKGETQDYWDIVHLPLGMCYFEMNHPNLAIHHLNKAKQIIDKLNLLHMHGVIEYYLFKSYYILRDTSAMRQMIEETTADFSNMHYETTDLLIGMFKILYSDPNDQQIQPDIERFELEYMKRGIKNPFILLETMAYLKIKGVSDLVTVEDMVGCLEKLRYVGNVSYIQLILVLLAQMHAAENNQHDATECLKEAVSIYKEFGISAAFYTAPLSAIHLIAKIDRSFYLLLMKRTQSSEEKSNPIELSAREMDIMKLIAASKSNDEISKTLFISIGTVKWHINHIFAKLCVSNRIQAIEKAKSLQVIS